MCHDKLATAPQAHTKNTQKDRCIYYIHTYMHIYEHRVCMHTNIDTLTRTIAPLSPITGSQTKIKNNTYVRANMSARGF